MTKQNAIFIAEKGSIINSTRPVYQQMQSKLNYKIIGWFPLAGHIMEFDEPDDGGKFSWDNVPYIPANIADYDWDSLRPKAGENLYRPVKTVMGGKSGKQRADDIAKFMKDNHVDFVISAGDPDREGGLLVLEVLNNLNIPVEKSKRFYVNDLTPKGISQGLSNLLDLDYKFKDGSSIRGIYQAGVLRSMIDRVMGYSYTPALTLKTGMLIRAGRIKLPTLNLVVTREKEILNFKPKTFYTIEEEFTAANGKYIGQLIDDNKQIIKFDNQQDAEKTEKTLKESNLAKIVSLDKKQQRVRPPQMYKTNDIVSMMAKKYSFKTIQDEMEDLYSIKKIMTYPRTDTKYLTDGQVEDFSSMLKAASYISELAPYVSKISQEDILRVGKDKRYVNSKKAGAHSALAPTGKKFDFGALSKIQQEIMMQVAGSFVKLFLPDQVVEKTDIVTAHGKHLFSTKGKVQISAGWTVLNSADSKDTVLPSVSKDEAVSVAKTNLNKGQTKPPAFYTDSSLIRAMENVANQVDDVDAKKILKETKGLGTDTSQPAIIEGLKASKLIEVKKKKLHPTAEGTKIIDALHGMDIIDPISTAKFEENLDAVSKEEITPLDYQNNAFNYVSKQCKIIYDSNTIPTLGKRTSSAKSEETSISYNGETIQRYTNDKGSYYLIHLKEDKVGFIPAKPYEHEFTDEEINKLLAGNTLKNITFKMKDKSVTCDVVFDFNKGKLRYIFPDRGENTGLSYEGVPVKLYDGKYGKFYFAKLKSGKLGFNQNLHGHLITIAEAKRLLNNEILKDLAFQFKNGESKADIKLILDSKDKNFGKIAYHFHNENSGKKVGEIAGEPIFEKNGKYGKYYSYKGANINASFSSYVYTLEDIKNLFSKRPIPVKYKTKSGREREDMIIYDWNAKKITFYA